MRRSCAACPFRVGVGTRGSNFRRVSPFRGVSGWRALGSEVHEFRLQTGVNRRSSVEKPSGFGATKLMLS
jgi:hypothetical protein